MRKLLKNRAVAVVAMGWLATGICFAALAVTAMAASGGAVLDDVQVGERKNMTRIALLCSPACNLETDESGDFLLRGLNANVDIDLRSRSKYVRSFATALASNGSRIKIIAAETVHRVDNKTCKIGGRTATCIDLFFGDEEPALKPLKRTELTSESFDTEQIVAPPKIRPTVAQKTASMTPVLRETATDRFSQFAQLAPPERLAPPAPTFATVTQINAKEPENNTENATLPPKQKRDFNFAKDSHLILGKNFDAASCAAAESTLQADAWALEAMVELGFCRAISGDGEAANGIFLRLLAYTPDNYEALVGRALLAAEADDRTTAAKYFQDALNALPPVAESNRIVAIMNNL